MTGDDEKNLRRIASEIENPENMWIIDLDDPSCIDGLPADLQAMARLIFKKYAEEEE